MTPSSLPRSLTVREREVAALITDCRTTKQIAGYLGVNEQRVRQLTDAVASKIDADRNGDVRVAIAKWWSAQAA